MAHVTKSIAIIAMLASAPAWACDSAEKLRLGDEIKSLAQKNAWAGVERKYGEIQKTKCDVSPDLQLVAADSALNIGKTFERWERLSAANAVETNEEVTEAMSGIEISYGRVHVRGDPRRPAPLLREAMPFAPDQRKSIEWAQKVVENTGSFKGMLPAGEYKVADKTFVVVPGATDFVLIQIGKASKNPDKQAGEGRPPGKGLINWAGLTATVGGGLLGSPAPNKPIIDSKAASIEWLTGPQTTLGVAPDKDGNRDGGETCREYEDVPNDADCYRTDRQPTDIAMGGTPNIEVTVGLEVGLTYRKPEMGLVVTGTYRGMVFGKSLHQMTVHAGWLIRPGFLRFTVGPTYSLVAGSGTGLAGWVFEGQRESDVNLSEERYSGLSGGGGAAGSAGFTVLDLGPFTGLVEAHGHWMYDGARSYQGFGLRVGITPKIERFKE